MFSHSLRPIEAFNDAVCYVRLTSPPAGRNAQKPDIPIEPEVDQFDLSRNILAARSLECVVCFWGGRWQRLDSRHGCKAADSDPAAEHVSRLPARRARLLPRTHTVQMWTVRRAEGRRTHRDIGSKVGGAGRVIKGSAAPFCQTKEDPAHVCPQMSWTPRVAHRLAARQSNRTRKATGHASEPIAHSGIGSVDAMSTAARFCYFLLVGRKQIRLASGCTDGS